MKKVDLVVFDIAGTTIEDDDAVNASLRAALKNAGFVVSHEVVNPKMGWPKPLAIQWILMETTGDALPEQVEAIHSDFVAQMIHYYQTTPRLREVEGAAHTFRALKEAGIKVALDTGFSRPITDVIVNRLGWDEGLLDSTICPEEVDGLGRPHPDMIFALMERLGVSDAARVAKIGDTPSDLQEGNNADCGYIIGVTGGTHSRDQLESYPHTHLLNTVAELPALLLS